VENRKDPKQILQDQIHEKYLKCIDSPNADNMILAYNLIVRWCRKYTFIKKITDVAGDTCIQADELGVDIYEVLDKWVKEKKLFNNESKFINCLRNSLKNRLNAHYRECPHGLKLSKKMVQIHKLFEGIKSDREGNLGRKLSYQECEELFLEVTTGKELKIKNYNEYKEIIYHKDTRALSRLPMTEDGDLIDYDSFQDKKVSDSHISGLINIQDDIIRDAVREILKKENNPCLNDLLTKEFMNSPKCLSWLAEFKNNGIIQSYNKTGIKPLLKDIYAKYYDVKPDSAGPGANQLVENFKKKLQKKIKNNINLSIYGPLQ